MRINWEIFFGNSSTEQALCEFSAGEITLSELGRACWPRECKRAVKSLKARGNKKAKRSARYALRTRGFAWRLSSPEWL